jgi:hypothetical protein
VCGAHFPTLKRGEIKLCAYGGGAYGLDRIEIVLSKVARQEWGEKCKLARNAHLPINKRLSLLMQAYPASCIPTFALEPETP